MMHPLRLERFMISDMNPMLWPLQVMAQAVRENRRPVARGQPARQDRAGGLASRSSRSLDRYRDLRDRSQELLFKTIYNSPLVEALAGLRAPYADARKPRARDEHAEQLLAAKIAAIKTREEQGGFAEARAAHHARGGAGRAHVRCARLPARPADQAGASGAAAHPARADAGRGQGGGVHAALRPGAGARRAAAACCRAERSGARRSRSCGGSATPTARSRRRARPMLAQIERILGLDQAGRVQAEASVLAGAARPQRRPNSATPAGTPP